MSCYRIFLKKIKWHQRSEKYIRIKNHIPTDAYTSRGNFKALEAFVKAAVANEKQVFLSVLQLVRDRIIVWPTCASENTKNRIIRLINQTTQNK